MMSPLFVAMQEVASQSQVPLNVMGFILIAAGGFTAFGAYKDWNWIVQGGRGGALILKALGRRGARIFQFSLGVIFFAMGIGMTALHYLVPAEALR